MDHGLELTFTWVFLFAAIMLFIKYTMTLKNKARKEESTAYLIFCILFLAFDSYLLFFPK